MKRKYVKKKPVEKPSEILINNPAPKPRTNITVYF